MTVENIITIISVIAAISGIIFGAAAFARNKRDDNREDGSYRSDIGYIKASMDDIKRKLDKQEQQYLDLVTRLTAVESSAKQAHHRIDRLEGNKRKLTSRKLWVALAGFIAGLIVAFGGSSETAETVSGCILSGAAVVGYVIGEGLADSGRENGGGDDGDNL